jgi:hypothetical protein
MMPARRRQIERLEKLAAPAIEEVRRQDEARKAQLKQAATWHAIGLGALVLYGKANMHEPLSQAWRRCSERFPYLERVLDFKHPSPQVHAMMIADIVRRDVLADLPGSTENEKFQSLFSSAPAWLVWFTFADVTAGLLGLTLPDLSGVKNFGRSETELRNWPALPDGKFEPRPRPRPSSFDISTSDATFAIDLSKIPEEQWTRLERKRMSSILNKLPPPNVPSIRKHT